MRQPGGAWLHPLCWRVHKVVRHRTEPSRMDHHVPEAISSCKGTGKLIGVKAPDDESFVGQQGAACE